MSFYGFVRFLARTALSFYYAEVESAGRVPETGPLLLLANHPTSLVDPLFLISASPRPVRFIAKEPLFRVPVLGFFLRRLGCLPAWRSQDPGYAKEKNEALFAAVAEALSRGAAIGLFPEGRSHTDPALGELKHGAARMAFDAEARHGFRLGLRLQPVGIQFERTRLFRGRVLLTFAPEISIGDRRAEHEADPRAAVERLTGDLRERLSAAILDAREEELARLLEHAGRGRLQERFADRRRLLDAIRAASPEESGRIVRLLRRLARLRGATGGPGLSGRFLKDVARVALGLPFLAVGIAVNAVPYLICRAFARSGAAKEGRGEDVRASYGLLAAVVVFPLAYAAMAWALIRWGPAGAWIALLAVGPSLGLLAARSLERWRRAGEEAAALLRGLGRPELRRRFRALEDETMGRLEELT